jgi:hypothetical protein
MKQHPDVRDFLRNIRKLRTAAVNLLKYREVPYYTDDVELHQRIMLQTEQVIATIDQVEAIYKQISSKLIADGCKDPLVFREALRHAIALVPPPR